MMKKLTALLLAGVLALSLAACGSQQQEVPDDGTLTIAATTYPVYLFAQTVIQDVPDLTLTLVVDQPVSCLHDYTLSVNDMKTLEGADLILLNGAGLEDTMSDALSSLGSTPQIDCSQGISLLPGEDGDEADPHIWLDPRNAAQMVETMAEALAQIDPDHADLYETNAALAAQTLAAGYDDLKDQLSDLSCRELITFHDGFQYFANAFDLTILRSIEEESGSEASAKEVAEIIDLVNSHSLPAVFTERNGSDSTAQMIQRETGTAIGQLDLIMSREDQGQGVEAYLAALGQNINTIQEVLS